MSSGDYVRSHYKVPAHVDGRVTVDGRPGVITGFQAARLLVRFDGESESVPVHPTWRVTYELEEVPTDGVVTDGMVWESCTPELLRDTSADCGLMFTRASVDGGHEHLVYGGAQ